MNKINKINHYVKNNMNTCGLLIILVIILIIIAFYRVIIQIDIGAPYDTYDFLANAAEFAGKSIGYTDLRPPFLSFLTSIFFRFDGLSISTIFYVDAVIDILGAIGLYFFLKLKFDNLNSFLGSLLFFTFPIVLTYVGVGYPDLPSVAIGIWALYFTVLAVKKDSRFFFISFPIAVMAFLTKYNLALIIFPILFYILINWQKIKKQDLFIGILISLVITSPFLIYFNFKYGNPISPFLNFYGTSSGSNSNLHFDYNPDLLFYIKLFPFLVGNGAYLIILTLSGGLLLCLIRLLYRKTSIPKFTINLRENYKTKFIALILVIIFLISLKRVSYLFSEFIFFFLLLSLFKLIKSKDNIDLDFLFFSWFMAFLIFNSVYVVKDIRYFLTMMPPISYFLIRGLVIVENYVGLIKNRKLTFYLVPLIVVIILISTSFYMASLPKANENSKNMNIDMDLASKWLMSYDSEYKSKVIFSDLWPQSGWLLETDIQKMPQFKDNKAYYNSLGNYKPTKQDSEDANKFLVENNADYYFSIRTGLNLTSFTPIKQFGMVIIYKRL